MSLWSAANRKKKKTALDTYVVLVSKIKTTKTFFVFIHSFIDE